MTLIIIFILFVLYMLACIADGPDVKPLWKRWLGTKLEDWANQLKPINYCDRLQCKFYNDYKRPAPFTVTASDIKKLEIAYEIGEDQLYEAQRNEDIARRHHLYIPPHHTLNGIIAEHKRRITEDVLHAAKPFVNIDVIRDEWDYKIHMIGSILVGKPKSNSLNH